MSQEHDQADEGVQESNGVANEGGANEGGANEGGADGASDAEDYGRRAFFRAAAAAGAAVGGAVIGGAVLGSASDAQAQLVAKPTAPASLLPEGTFAAKLSTLQAQMTREDLSKDVKLRMAADILKSLDNVEIEWVKGSIPATRRVIQIKG